MARAMARSWSSWRQTPAAEATSILTGDERSVAGAIPASGSRAAKPCGSATVSRSPPKERQQGVSPPCYYCKTAGTYSFRARTAHQCHYNHHNTRNSRSESSSCKQHTSHAWIRVMLKQVYSQFSHESILVMALANPPVLGRTWCVPLADPIAPMSCRPRAACR